ncbi:MAG: carboxymuconolactone decarboxylase family protein [Pseudoruegeria sp.]
MNSLSQTPDAIQTEGAKLSDLVNPNMREILGDQNGELLPDMADAFVNMDYGQLYGRTGPDIKNRYIATNSARSAFGGQTAPQSKIAIQASHKSGLNDIEIAESIWQMVLSGGLSAAINGQNTLLEVLEQNKEPQGAP